MCCVSCSRLVTGCGWAHRLPPCSVILVGCRSPPAQSHFQKRQPRGFVHTCKCTVHNTCVHVPTKTSQDSPPEYKYSPGPDRPVAAAQSRASPIQSNPMSARVLGIFVRSTPYRVLSPPEPLQDAHLLSFKCTAACTNMASACCTSSSNYDLLFFFFQTVHHTHSTSQIDEH